MRYWAFCEWRPGTKGHRWITITKITNACVTAYLKRTAVEERCMVCINKSEKSLLFMNEPMLSRKPLYYNQMLAAIETMNTKMRR